MSGLLPGRCRNQPLSGDQCHNADEANVHHFEFEGDELGLGHLGGAPTILVDDVALEAAG
jgi:hypothetical protein